MAKLEESRALFEASAHLGVCMGFNTKAIPPFKGKLHVIQRGRDGGLLVGVKKR